MKYMRTFVIIFLCIFSYIIGKPEIINGEHPIVVIVPSYNNSQWSENTLDSIFSQNYTNFRVIIVDDCSTDNNVEVIQRFIDNHDLADQVTFIKNETRHRKLFNLYRVLYECHDDEIVFMVDGDDSLNGPDVFSHINALYQDEDIWFTYGQYRNVPASQAIAWGHKEMGYCRPVPKHIQHKHAYRYYSFIYMHPRSFRAWLFKLVKLEDLIADNIKGFVGDFYPASNDVAMYFPMVEMAHTHIKFIPEILYIRNLYSEIVGFKVDRYLQTSGAREIRKKYNYATLFQPKKYRLDHLTTTSTDIFLLYRYNLTDVENYLHMIEDKIKNIDIIYLFFHNTVENKKICRFISKKFPHVVFIPCDPDGTKSVKSRLLEHLSLNKNEHVLLLTDGCTLNEPVYLSHYIFWLEKTFAYRFYLNRQAIGSDTPTFIPLTPQVCAWKISNGASRWKTTNPLQDPFVCRKSTLYQEIKQLNFNNIFGFLRQLHTVPLPACVGLFPRDQVVSYATDKN
jgi:glycosyltransferase involved in cell wall biosynthesis